MSASSDSPSAVPITIIPISPVRSTIPAITRAFVDAGVWVRPFGRLVYLMPPYIIDDADLDCLTAALVSVVKQQ